jgi:hypothetical protein
MFERIDICLSQAICKHNAVPENLSWAVTKADDGRSGLRIFCRKCDAAVDVPPEKFVALYKVASVVITEPAEKEATQKLPPNAIRPIGGIEYPPTHGREFTELARSSSGR